MAIYIGFNPPTPVNSLRVKGMVLLGHKSDVRTEFTVRATGFREGAATLSDESGCVLFTGRRSWNLVVFTRNGDNTLTTSYRSYDLYTAGSAGTTMSADIQNIPDGADVCVFTYDEPFTNKNTITDALLTLGGTQEKLNALPFRGSYVLVGRKGMASGQAKEYQVNAGGAQAQIVFVNGVMQ
ncbi:hypothetical protein OOP60_001214 [Salmonella enterica]|nr:hypothetical protein [Salmonella enterica]EKB5473306.1 hypothetical protein [Salmonella enterica]ELL0513024.1 hypothetical protein [Salmonella enterica]